MRVDLQPSIILHRRAYRDTSLILDVFSQEHGRVSLVARGARRPKAKWRGVLEPLRALRLSWSGRGEMQTLTAAEPEGRQPVCRGDHLYAAFYGAELVMRLTARHDPHPLLFERLLELIARLAAGDDMALQLRRFERDLLHELGYGLLLDQEADSGLQVTKDKAYCYHPDHGLRISDGRTQAVEVLISGDTLIALSQDRLETKAHLGEAKTLLTAALAPHLGGKPLQSAQTLRALIRLKNTGANTA